MGKRILALLAVFLFALLTALPVSADMGPKPSIVLTVINAPDEKYYIDLLYSKSWHRTADDKEIAEILENAPESDREMMRTIVEYVSEDGMTARLGSPISDMFTHSDSKGEYKFDYSSIPDEFRVIIVTESGKIILSDVCNKKAYNAAVTYDAKTGDINEQASGYIKPLISKFAFTCFVTLFVEALIFEFDGYKFSEGKNLAVFLLTNFLTQLLLYFGIETVGIRFAFAEFGVVAVEALIYSLLLTPKNPKKASIQAIIANIFSVMLGTPAWLAAEFLFKH